MTTLFCLFPFRIKKIMLVVFPRRRWWCDDKSPRWDCSKKIKTMMSSMHGGLHIKINQPTEKPVGKPTSFDRNLREREKNWIHWCNQITEKLCKAIFTIWASKVKKKRFMGRIFRDHSQREKAFYLCFIPDRARVCVRVCHIDRRDKISECKHQRRRRAQQSQAVKADISLSIFSKKNDTYSVSQIRITTCFRF